AGMVAALASIVVSTVGIGPAILLALALMVTRPLVLMHLSVASEPVLLSCFAILLLVMARQWPAWVGGCIAAAAAIVSYAGVAATIAMIVWQARRPGARRQRTVRAVTAA